MGNEVGQGADSVPTPKRVVYMCCAAGPRPVVVATIQSAMQAKTLDRLEGLGFDLMVVDEAHHATADRCGGRKWP